MRVAVSEGGFTYAGDRTGVLLIHGLTASPGEMAPLGNRLHEDGFTVSGVLLAGHGTDVDDLRRTTWTDWLDSARRGLTSLQKECDEVFVVGLSAGALLAALLAAEGGVAGLSLLAPAYRLHTRGLFLAPWMRPFLRDLSKGRRRCDFYRSHGLFTYPVVPVVTLRVRSRRDWVPVVCLMA